MNFLNDKTNTIQNQTIQNNAFDLQSLRRLTGSLSDKNESLKEAAEQFEGVFVRQLLSSMRKVNDIFKKDSLFESSSSDFYQGMWDDQIAGDLSTGSSSSISAMLIQQLGGDNQQKYYRTHTNAIKSDLNAAVISNAQPKKQQGLADSVRDAVFKENIPSEVEVNTVRQIMEPEKFSSKEEFVNYLTPFAKEAANRLGSSAKILLAQAALETGWGKHFVEKTDNSSSKNLFNIKDKSDWQGEVAVKNSLEFDGEQFSLKKSAFRVYETFQESFDDFVNFLSSRERYSSVVEHASDPEKYLTHLQDSGYATDPNYAKKINRILNSNILQKIVD